MKFVLGKKLKRCWLISFFPHNYYNLLRYTTVDYRHVNSYKDDHIQNIINQPQNQDY
jgi:hypothetical protein